jgi:hypothetical protein
MCLTRVSYHADWKGGVLTPPLRRVSYYSVPARAEQLVATN